MPFDPIITTNFRSQRQISVLKYSIYAVASNSLYKDMASASSFGPTTTAAPFFMKLLIFNGKKVVILVSWHDAKS